jgi:WD40 repeat protein
MSHKKERRQFQKWPLSKLLQKISNRNNNTNKSRAVIAATTAQQQKQDKDDNNFPHIPGSVLVSHVLPFLDRITYNRLCLASKDVYLYQASRRPRHFHLIPPPWPQGRFRVGKLVTAVAFSPDGQTLAVASNHKKIHLWNVQKGLDTKLQGHDKPVTDLAYSPDGKWLASVSLSEHTIRLWSVVTNDDDDDDNNYQGCSQIWNNTEHYMAGVGVCNLLFSPNSKHLAVWGDNGSAGIRILNILSSKGEMEAIDILSVPEEEDDDDSFQQRLRVVAYSPDQTTLISCVEGEYKVTMWNNLLLLSEDYSSSSISSSTRANHSQVELPQHTSATSIAYTPDGSHFVIGYKNGTIEFWNSKGLVLETTSRVSKAGSSSYVTNITFSHDGSILACGTGSKLKLFRYHDPFQVLAPTAGRSTSTNSTQPRSTIDCIATFQGHSDRIESISFCSDGETIATGADKTIRLWKIPKTQTARISS